MKNYLKFASAVMVAGISLGAHAAVQQVCSGSAGNGSAVSASDDGSVFVRTAFTPQCSANVLMKVDQSSTAIWGGSVSKKGKNYFGGSSNGGAIRALGTCAGTSGCQSGDVDTGVSAASTFGSSS